MSDKIGLIYDLDNTLVRCNEYYIAAKRRFISELQTLFPGVQATKISAILTQIESAAIQGELGFARERYPKSMVATYRRLCAEHGVEVDEEVAERIYAIGDSVFSAPYEPFDGVREMLEAYKRAGIPLGLCTKGDEDVQWRKIRRNGLDAYFDSIVICPRKHAEDILRAAKGLTEKHDVVDFYMIGDSLRDDILGGNELGFTTILVQPEESVSWHYEMGFEHVQPTYVVRRVTDMVEIVPANLDRHPIRRVV